MSQTTQTPPPSDTAALVRWFLLFGVTFALLAFSFIRISKSWTISSPAAAAPPIAAPAVTYPGDEEFGGNIDLELEVPEDVKAKDLLPYLWVEAPDGSQVDTLGYEDVSPGRVSLTFHHPGFEESPPNGVPLYWGPAGATRKIAVLPVIF